MTTKKTLVRRALSLLLTLLMVLSLVPVSVISVYAAEEPKLNDDGYYEIETYEDLCWYRDQVNADRIDINAILMNDIVVNENVLDDEGNLNDGTFLKWEGIGDNFNGPTLVGFYGIFDGNGKTISGIYTNFSNGSFIRQNYGVIKNLNIVDSYFGGASFCGNYNYGSIINCSSSATIYNTSISMGGICQTNDGLVENCTFTGKIITRTSDSWYVGGICARNYSTILNCYSSADVSGYSGFGGISGPNNGTVENCCSTGNVTISSTSMGRECYGVADGTVINSYYINTSMDSGSNAVAVSQDQLESGEVAYLLQGTQTDEIWGQKIGTDTAPVLGGDKVYYGYDSCADDATEVYTNNSNVTADKPNHNFENGFCTVCGGFEPATDENEDGVFEIANAGQLYWFADKVNNDNANFGSADAILTSDIVVNEGVMNKNSTDVRVWTPIGIKSKSYTGIFDGNNKTVSGLYVNEENKQFIGLFGYVGTGCEIKSIGIINSYFKGLMFVGGVVGYAQGITITNCYNTSSVVGQNYAGGVAGYAEESTVANCYITGNIEGTDGIGMIGWVMNITVENCYYLNTSCDVGIGNVSDAESSIKPKTAEAFASGEVAYLLQGEQEELVWGQTIGTETAPVLGGDKVYYGYTSCEDDATEVYTNNSNATADKHVASFINGFCTDCGVFEPATLNDNGTPDDEWDDYYEISNAGQLYWFGEVAAANDNYSKAVLTDDIIVNEDLTAENLREWIAIGESSSMPYCGTFDGQGHFISGLYAKSELNYIGLFGAIGWGATISNLGIKDSYFEGNYYVAGIAGYNDYSYVINCYAEDVEIVSNNDGGAVVGYNYGEVSNSYSTSDSFVGNNNYGTITNCYYLADEEIHNEDGLTFKTAEQFASGEVAYLLQSGVVGEEIWDDELGEYVQIEPEHIWGQKIGTDLIPTLGGNRVYAITDSEDNITGYTNTVQTDKLAGYSISLGDKIAVNYYMSLTEKTLNDANAKMVFTVPDTGSTYTLEIPVSEAVKSGDYYVFTCEVAAKEMTSVISAKLVTSESELQLDDYTVQEYAEVILSDTVKYAKEQELVKKMLNYGTQAQKYFDYNTDSLANDTELMTEEEKVTELYGFAGAPFTLEGEETGVTYYGTALSLETELAFKHYFIIDESVDIESLKITCDYPATLKKNGSFYELIISDIPAHKMGEGSLKVSLGGITLDYTIYSYGALAQNSGKEELWTVVSALAHFAGEATMYAYK